MRVSFVIGREAGYMTVYREDGDRKYYGMAAACGEHALLHNLKKWLNARGFDLIKKRAQKDGHCIGDEYQPYLRTRAKTTDAPHICIYSGFYQLRGANEDWNGNGEVRLTVHGAYFEHQDETACQPDWFQRIAALADRYDDIECELHTNKKR